MVHRNLDSRHRSFLRLMVAVVVCAAPRFADADGLPPQDDARLAGISREIAEARAKIKTGHVRYRRSERGFSVKRDGEKFDVVELIDVAFADQRFRYQSEDVSGISTSKQFLFHPEHPRLLFDGRNFCKHWVDNRIVHLTEFRNDAKQGKPPVLPDVSQNCKYLEKLGFSPSPLRASIKRRYFLPDALQQQPYQVIAERESLGGVECLVLNIREKFVSDTIWLHPETGWSLRKRVIETRGDSVRQDDTVTWIYDDYRSPADGIWLPWKILAANQRREKNSERFALVGETTFDVEQLTVNEHLEDSLFEPVYLPGTIVENTRNGQKKVIPGGETIIENIVEKAVKHFHWQDRPVPASSHQQLVYQASMGASLVIGAVVCLLTRRPNGKTRPIDGAPRKNRVSHA